MKVMVAIAFLLIAASLGSALFFMLRGNRGNDDGRKPMAWALTVRIGLSVLIFLGILLAWKLGYIQPHGIPMGG